MREVFNKVCSVIPEVISSVEESDWQMTNSHFSDVLEISFLDENIIFEVGDVDTPRNSKFIVDGGFYECGDIEIVISKKNNVSKYFRQDKNNAMSPSNDFFRELFITLSHETVHRNQFHEGRLIQGNEEDPLVYFSNPCEIEANAMEAACEYYYFGRREAFDLYKKLFKRNKKPLKWFMSLYREFLIKIERGKI